VFSATKKLISSEAGVSTVMPSNRKIYKIITSKFYANFIYNPLTREKIKDDGTRDEKTATQQIAHFARAHCGLSDPTLFLFLQ
jgi:hypothetical protein